MSYSEIISQLSAGEKVTLAATLAATTMQRDLPPQPGETPMHQIVRRCELTQMVFGKMLNFLESGEEPPRFPDYDGLGK